MGDASGWLERLRGAAAGKFQRDALWNFASVGVLGVCGFALQLLIGRHYGAAPLGVFNQVMAAYIVFGQAGVGGINLSALRAISERRDDRARVRAIIVGALVPTLALALACTLVFWGTRNVLAGWLQSPGVALGIEAATPGLFFFALNKVGMSIVNAAQRMRAFALYTSLRYTLMVGGLLIAMAFDLSSDRLAFLFSFAEGLLFVPLAIEVLRQLDGPASVPWRPWSWEHLRYGAKSAASGMLLELNSRVDVLMLGLFLLSDGPVGVYSIAALVAEGVFQLLVVLQNNYNPVLAEHIAAGKLRELEALVARGRRTTYLLFLGCAALAIAGFPVFLAVLQKEEFRAGWLPFAFLMLGMLAASGYMPFAQTLLMANRPGWHTLMMASVVLCNVVFNATLIPLYGLEGAAAATALSLLWAVFALKIMVRRQVGLRL